MRKLLYILVLLLLSASMFSQGTQKYLGGGIEVYNSDSTNVIGDFNATKSINTQSLYKILNDTFALISSSSVFIGKDNGYLGDDNTFLGINAGNVSQSGALRNAFIGGMSGSKNTTGDDNVFIGYSSGLNNTTGIWNVAVGSQALYSAQALSQNTAIGYKSFYSINSGTGNVGIGYNVAANIIQGTDNVFIGNNCATGAASSNNQLNVCIGRQNMALCNGATENTSIGHLALKLNVSGDGNVCLGKNSGDSITGSNNVIIGTDVGGAWTGSNRLMIDNSNTSSPLIDGFFDDDSLVINGFLNIDGRCHADRSSIDSIYHAYGGFEDSAVVVSITQNVWAQVTNASGDLFQGVEADGVSISGDTMIFDHTADYIGSMNITYTGTNSNVFKMRIYNVTDGAQVNFVTGTTGDGGSDYVTMNLPLYFEVTAGDRYVLQVTNINAGNDMTVRFGTFYVVYLHD